MRHIRKFNEDLDPSTYNKVARKLIQKYKDNPRATRLLDIDSRANKLFLHSKNIRKVESINKYKQNIKTLSKYGEVSLKLGNIDSDCYLSIEIDPTTYDELIVANLLCIHFFVYVVPKDLDTYKEIIDRNKFEDCLNGSVPAYMVDVMYQIGDGNIEFKGLSVMDYDNDNIVSFIDRKGLNRFKNYMCNLFEQKSDYPSGYSDIKDMYDKIEIDIIQKFELEIDYGLDMNRILNDLKSVPYDNFISV